MRKSEIAISIVGCGWLGLPLAEKALHEGHHVNGSTTSTTKLDELKMAGLDAYLFSLPGNTEVDSALFEADYLILNIPPGRRNPNVLLDYPASIASVLKFAVEVGKIRKIIFISSTSVYQDNIDYIDEFTITNPQTSSGEALLKAEALIMDSGLNHVILRFGGLAGPGRHPGRFLAGKSNLPAGNQAINFLHLEDAIGAINCFINKQGESKIYNVVSPLHPTKKEFYTTMATQLKLEAPRFNEEIPLNRREISPQKFISETGYKFIFPDPMHYQF
jgi:nucleoside-diphosphate-sugar epimerase